MDKALFVVSRLTSSAGSLITLILLASVYGKSAVGDFTLGLAICAPICILMTIGFPSIIIEQHQEGAVLSRRIPLSRIAIVLPVVAIAGIISASSQGYLGIIAAVLIIKSADVIFEPVVVWYLTTKSGKSIGRELLVYEIIRAASTQGTLIFASFYVDLHPAKALLVTGAVAASLSSLILFAAPEWGAIERSSGFRGCLLSMRVLSVGGPVTVATLLVALQAVMPRYLMESSMTEVQRAAFGIGYVSSSVLGLMVHSAWSYSLAKRVAELNILHLRAILRKNLTFSIAVIASLVGVIGLLYTIRGVIESAFGQSQEFIRDCIFMAFILSLPHCFSSFRDTVRLSGAYWLEVATLLISIGVIFVIGLLALHYWPFGWILFCAGLVCCTITAQTTLSVLALVYKTRSRLG